MNNQPPNTVLDYDLLLEQMMEHNVPTREIFDFPWLLCLNDRDLFKGFRCRCGTVIGHTAGGLPVASVRFPHKEGHVNVAFSQCFRCRLVHYQPSWG